jgi:hypothetical protein
LVALVDKKVVFVRFACAAGGWFMAAQRTETFCRWDCLRPFVASGSRAPALAQLPLQATWVRLQFSESTFASGIARSEDA